MENEKYNPNSGHNVKEFYKWIVYLWVLIGATTNISVPEIIDNKEKTNNMND